MQASSWISLAIPFGYCASQAMEDLTMDLTMENITMEDIIVVG
jgi:hypothetical protein